MILAWLRAGVFEPGKGFAPTEEGSPQGGVISPCLLNVALHGLEEAAGVRYGPDGIRTAQGSPVLVRYCDDFVVCCHTRQQAEQVKARLAGWLAPRGLAFNDEKTTSPARSSSSTPTPATAHCSSTQSCSSPMSGASLMRQSPSPEAISVNPARLAGRDSPSASRVRAFPTASPFEGLAHQGQTKHQAAT